MPFRVFFNRRPPCPQFFHLGCTFPCNFSRSNAYTGREPIAKEEPHVRDLADSRDVDDLIFQDIWLISDR